MQKKRKKENNNTFKSRQKKGVTNTWVHTLSQEKGCLLDQSEDRQITLIFAAWWEKQYCGLKIKQNENWDASFPVPRSRLFLS